MLVICVVDVYYLSLKQDIFRLLYKKIKPENRK